MRYVLQISLRAVPGRDADYNTWYDDVHVHEVLALPGFQSCERFMREGGGGQAPEYLALYEVETNDPQALLQSLFDATPTMRLTDAIDPASARFEFLRPTGSGPVHAG